MNRKRLGNIAIFVLIMVFCLSFSSAYAAGKETKCRMKFTLNGKSFLYDKSSGAAEIICDNGQAANVLLDIKGGGFTAGKSRLSGVGTFSPVWDISELYGSYARAEAHAGVVESAGAQVLAKGEVSLALSGTGKGVNLGISFGKVIIKPLPDKNTNSKSSNKKSSNK